MGLKTSHPYTRMKISKRGTDKKENTCPYMKMKILKGGMDKKEKIWGQTDGPTNGPT
jgi:hypothetical protein